MGSLIYFIKSKEKNKEIITLKAMSPDKHLNLFNALLFANTNPKNEEKKLAFKSIHKTSITEKLVSDSPENLSFENPLFIDKEFIKNNIGDSLITLKAK